MELLSLGYVYSCFSCTKQHGIDIPKQCLFLVPTTWRIAIPTPSTLQISFSLSSKVQNQEIISIFMIRFAMLHCHYAHNLWTMVFCWFGLHWIIPKMVVVCWLGFVDIVLLIYGGAIPLSHGPFGDKETSILLKGLSIHLWDKTFFLLSSTYGCFKWESIFYLGGISRFM